MNLKSILDPRPPQADEDDKDIEFRQMDVYSARMYFVYLLQCKDKSIYTGITTDVRRRLAEHKAGKGGHYTRAKKVAKLLYQEKQPDRSSASKREAEIKKWSRGQKLKLIRSAKA